MSGRILGRIGAAAASLALYLPIIAGLISPMVWVMAAWYWSWDLLSYVVPFSNLWHGLFGLIPTWVPTELQIEIAVVFRIFQIVLFSIGLYLLCYGLLALVKARARKDGLVTSGPYRWVRHPQHLGIFLMLFFLVSPPSRLYQPFLAVFSRPGDIISMSTVAFLLLLVADFEDHKMSTLYGDSFDQYRKTTPFMLPARIQLPENLRIGCLARGRPLRYLIAALIFWIWLVLLSYYFTLVPLLVTG
jgi:protein-S-isoprenylcysteine O-methyltransferase Ste14